MRRLLVVDDDYFQIDMLSRILKDLDVELVVADNVDTAFDIFIKDPCHAILSDLNMPGKSGLELLSNLRSLGYDVPFVILTGWGSPQQMMQATRLGASAMLEKPFDYRELIDAVHRALQIGFRTAKIREIVNQSDLSTLDLTRIEHEQKMIEHVKSLSHRRAE